MASTAQKREWWADWRCNTGRMVRVEFPGDKRTWSLLVADKSAPAWETFAELMREHDYPFRESAGGTYNCRQITGGTAYSLHAYGIALDLNPSKNPYGTQTHDFPQPFIDAVAETGLFRWGIGFDDPMHWEIDVPPDQIQEDTMLRPEVEQFVNDLFDRMKEFYPDDEVPTAAGISTYLLPDVRKNVITWDELKAALEGIEAGTVDEVARSLARQANQKLARIKAAI